MTADAGEVALTARNASIEDLVELLRGQQARKVDVVAPLRRMRTSRPELFDANVNGRLAADDRSFLIRCLRSGDRQPGVARAWLSDGYKPIDHLDTLMATFDGIRACGHPVSIDSCDLTEQRMYVRVWCEAVQVLAPALPAGYRSPFTGARGADNPVVFAGFAVANSETGCGAATVTPRLVAQVCSNGMTITRDAVRAIHLGERMDEGVRWSWDTRDRQCPQRRSPRAATAGLHPAG